MSRLLHRIRASLYERARFFVQERNVAQLLEEQHVEGPWLDSYQLLQTLTSVRALLPSVPPVLVDVGAHMGAFARAADKILGFERIICVEPDTELVNELSANAPQGKTSVHTLALSERDERAHFFVHEDRSMNSLLEADTEILRTKFPTYRHDSIAQREVRTTTLDSLLLDEGMLDGTEIFLKLDTQGNELNILRAAENTLPYTAACLVEFMFCSPYATEYTFRDLIDFLYDRGLECRGALGLTRRPSHEVSGVDFFFAR